MEIMIEPLLAKNEPGRLQALHNLEVLDTPHEERFDRITRLAQTIFSVPIVLVSLIDENRQWFKSCQGLDATETARGISFCGHAILAHDVFVIEDATLDARFADNPLVTGGPLIRFYAGAPLRLNSGHAAGTLCVISPKPRSFSDHDRKTLTELAAIVVQELEDIYTAARERELREFIESAGAIIQSVDEQGRLRMVNRAWTKALGYSAQEVAGRDIFDIIDSSEHEHCRAILEKLAASGSEVEVETLFIAKDGRKLRLSGILSVLKRPDGSIATRGIFQDVTARRDLERLRSEVTHHVSHELMTPLASTSLSLGMLGATSGAMSEEQKHLLTIAQNGTDHLGAMVKDLLDASRSASGKLSVTPVTGDLNAAITGITDPLVPLAARSGILLAVEAPAKNPAAIFDPVRLRQILNNLIGNAMKFTPKGGRISVGIREESEETLVVYVRDTGLGLKKDDLDRIFDRLYQTSNKALHGETGLGLGLHICRELVLAHGGKIWVDSETGKGTTFYFSLPRARLVGLA
jgi:PAS domain S-box-containing protein